MEWILPSQVAPATKDGSLSVDDDELRQLWNKAAKFPNDINLWNQIFDRLDEIIKQGPTANDELSSSIKQCYECLLNRFPYLTSYWDRYATTISSLSGDDSDVLDIMALAVTKNPHSITTWVRYLDLLSESGKKLQFIKDQFELAITLNGYHFFAQNLYDKWLLFIGNDQDEKYQLLLKLIHIPLYLYAQYYQAFTEINKLEGLDKLLNDQELKSYLERYQKSNVNELSTVETHQIIDDYCYQIFQSTQNQVEAKWIHESVILYHEFSLELYKETIAEVSKWTAYLEEEITAYNNSTTNRKQHFNIIVSIYERALVPNCFNADLWSKYIEFLEVLPDATTIEIVRTLKRATSILPLNDKSSSELRLKYVRAIYGEDPIKAMEELNWIYGIYCSETLNYQKEELIKLSKLALELVPSTSSQLGELLRLYSQEVKSKKRILEKKSDQILSSNETLLGSIQWNNDTIVFLLLHYLKALIIEKKDPKTIREAINTYFHDSRVQNFAPFWAFCIDFEGKRQHNLPNLKTIITQIKTNTKLPKATVDVFLAVHESIILANLPQYFQLNANVDKPDESLICWQDSSNLLALNKLWRKRLVIGRDISVEAFSKELTNRAGHPGVNMDHTPRITNSVDFLILGKGIPPLPTFKNVEKASMQIPESDH